MTVSIYDLPKMEITQIAALSAEQLHTLLEKVNAAQNRTNTIKACLDEAIAHRYSDRAALIRIQDDKPTGIVRFSDESFSIVADLPKKPAWDQVKMADAVKRIQESGQDLNEYVTIEYKVPESRYKAWPEFIRKFFEAARSVTTGKQTFKIERSDGR